MATEHSRNDGSKAQYYVVILDRLQDHSGGLERAPESRIRGPLTCITEVGGRTGKLRREVVRRLDEENACENKTAQDCHLCLRSVEMLKARPLCEEGLPE